MFRIEIEQVLDEIVRRHAQHGAAANRSTINRFRIEDSMISSIMDQLFDFFYLHQGFIRFFQS